MAIQLSNTFSKPIVLFSLLWGYVMFSALAVASVSHMSRVHYGMLEQAKKQHFDLKGEASRIALEYQALASLAQIEQRAADELQMQVVKPDRMVVVK